MKKLLVIGLAFCLLTTTDQSQCSASTKPLRYLTLLCQGFGAATLRLQTAAQWAVKNPYKIAGGIVAATTYNKFNALSTATDQLTTDWATSCQKNTDENCVAIKVIKELCKEHGIENVFIMQGLLPYEMPLAALSHENKMFILISNHAFNTIKYEHCTIPSTTDLTPQQLKAILIHEIGHLLKNDSQKARFLEVTLRSTEFKNELISGAVIGTGVHAVTKGISTLSKIPLPPRVRTLAIGILTAHGLLFAKALQKTGAATLDFSSLANATRRTIERRADDYVKETAFKKRDPQLLDDFAESFENYHRKEIVSGKKKDDPTHPPLLKRAQDARAAEAELRTLMKNGEVNDMSINTNCSPF